MEESEVEIDLWKLSGGFVNRLVSFVVLIGCLVYLATTH